MHVSSTWPRGILLLGAVTLAGCQMVARRPTLAPRPIEARATVFAEALNTFQARTLTPERIDPPAMLGGALEELAKVVDGAQTRHDDKTYDLTVDGAEMRVALVEARDITSLAGMLDAAVAWIAARRTGMSELQLQAAALRGAVRQVDRWATVVAGDDRELLMDRMRGTMGGIGCQIGRRDDAIVVLTVYRGTPAWTAGLREEDRLLAVDGTPTDGRQVSEIVKQLRGQAGTRVQLQVQRSGSAAPLSMDIERQRIVAPTVSTRMIRPGVGYLRVDHLAQNSGVFAKRALGGLREEPSLRGFVLDLRGNTGGSMVAAGQIADEFIDQGVLIETKGPGGQPIPDLQNRIAASADPTAPAQPLLPLVVLIDEKTGSNAEVLAAVLARHDRALLVGKSTFGKGVVQKVLPLGENLTLRLTVARIYAAGRPIPESGVEPDVAIADDHQATEPRCAPEAEVDNDRTVAFFPPPAEAPDPALSLATMLLDRYPSASRQSVRSALLSDLCTRGASAADGANGRARSHN